MEILFYLQVNLLLVINLDVFEAIKNRRSIRQYSNLPVESEKISRILEAARLSPSANNNQPWSFVVVTQKEARESLFPAYPREWFMTAQVVIVACADPKKAWSNPNGEDYWKVDVAIAVHNMCLAAYELGLGSCWVAAFDEQKIKNALGVPKELRVLLLLTLGYSAEEKGPVTSRKPLEDIVRYERWQLNNA